MKTQYGFTNPEEQLRFENEILKLKLETEMGALAINVPDNMPPALANAWLNSIYNFEKNHQNSENKKTVFEHLGKPTFKKVEELTPENVKKELEHFLTLLKEHGMELNVICSYEPAIIYNFIVTELFPYEILHVNESGGMTVFTYEEFHPNIDYDIRRSTDEFLWSFFDKREFNEFNLVFLNDKIHTKMGSVISTGECLLIMRDVQEVYKDRILYDIEISEIIFDNSGGKSISNISYSHHDGSEIKKVIVVLEFTSDYYYYTINRISIPGILEI